MTGSACYDAGMNQSTENLPAEERIEAEIDAVLAPHADDSIVDSLLALPGDEAAGAGPDEWNRGLHDRLQARLAQRMREAIGKTGKAEDAA